MSREVGSLRVGLAGSGKADAGWRDQAAITALTGPLVDCTQMVEDVRAHPLEVDEDGVREIVRVLEDGLDAVTTLARPGMSEWEVSGSSSNEIRKAGILTSLVFVSAGPLGQLPRGRPIRWTTSSRSSSRRPADTATGRIGSVFVGPSVRGEIVDRLQSWIQVAKECEGLVSAGAPAGLVATTLIERLSTVSQVDPSGLGHGSGSTKALLRSAWGARRRCEPGRRSPFTHPSPPLIGPCACRSPIQCASRLTAQARSRRLLTGSGRSRDHSAR